MEPQVTFPAFHASAPPSANTVRAHGGHVLKSKQKKKKNT